jgi:hypothetical protein
MIRWTVRNYRSGLQNRLSTGFRCYCSFLPIRCCPGLLILTGSLFHGSWIGLLTWIELRSLYSFHDWKQHFLMLTDSECFVRC